jgi:hypothetical protein
MKQAQKEEDRVEVGSNQYFDINTDQLIDMRRIMTIAGVSRSTLERWIRDELGREKASLDFFEPILLR